MNFLYENNLPKDLKSKRLVASLPCEQRLHFRGMSWRAKSSLCRQPFNFLSCMRKIRHAIRKQLVRQICVSFAGIKIAKTTCEQISSNFCFVFLLCPSVKFPRIVFWESIMLPPVASPVWFEGSTFNSKRQFFFRLIGIGSTLMLKKFLSQSKRSYYDLLARVKPS